MESYRPEGSMYTKWLPTTDRLFLNFAVLSPTPAQVVGHDEIMEMLTNYDYTIDYTSDAGGLPESWGAEAGHGIISASQMLRWVELNCSESCPGEAAAMLSTCK